MRHIEYKKPRIGLYSMGLKAYWSQFPGLRERLAEYGEFIAKRLETCGAQVFNYGLVDCEQAGSTAGDYFSKADVDF